MPNKVYNGQNPETTVNKGIIPKRPNHVSKIKPAIIIANPKTSRIILSMLPTFLVILNLKFIINYNAKDFLKFNKLKNFFKAYILLQKK